MFYVYVLQGEARPDRFYIGWSADLRRRMAEHNAGSNPSTRGERWRLVYYEAYLSESAARERERVLKGDGRTRRHLMARVKRMLGATGARGHEPFIGGERRTGE